MELYLQKPKYTDKCRNEPKYRFLAQNLPTGDSARGWESRGLGVAPPHCTLLLMKVTVQTHITIQRKKYKYTHTSCDYQLKQ